MTSQRFGGQWTEEKLDILRDYLDAYTDVMKNQQWAHLTYVDAFAGAGSYEFSSDDSKEFGKLREGSTRIALNIQDRIFDELVFIEKDGTAVLSLFALRNEYPERQIRIIQGDANVHIPRFCSGMNRNNRAVVFLDPYATQVSWSTVEAIAKTKKIDCWILFPRKAIAQMMPTDKRPDEATAIQLDRIFGGNSHWRESYQQSMQLPMLDEQPGIEREPMHQIVRKYEERLRTVFFKVVPTRHTLTNSRNAPLFDLFFAASNPRGADIATRIANDILKKRRSPLSGVQ